MERVPAPQIIGRTAALLRQEGQFVTAVLNALSALPGRYVQYLPMQSPNFTIFCKLRGRYTLYCRSDP